MSLEPKRLVGSFPLRVSQKVLRSGSNPAFEPRGGLTVSQTFCDNPHRGAPHFASSVEGLRVVIKEAWVYLHVVSCSQTQRGHNPTDSFWRTVSISNTVAL